MTRRLLILVICISFYHIVSGQRIYRKYSPQQMKEDIDTLVKYLEDTHPNPYYRYPKAQFYQDVQATKNSFSKDLSLLDFYLKAEPLLAKLDDGHTDFHILQDYDAENPVVLPYSFKLSPAAPFIICEGPYQTIDAQFPVKSKIVSINNIPAQKIVDDIINLNTGENRAFRADFGSSRFYFYLEALYKANGNYQIKYKDKAGDKTVHIKGMRQIELDKRKEDSPIKTSTAHEVNYSLSIIEQDKTAIIAFKNFDWNGYTAFADSAFTVISHKGIQHLIINLIDNAGGDSDVGDDLFQYLLDQPFRQYEKVVVKNSRFLKQRLKAHREGKTLDSSDIALLAKPDGTVDTVVYADIPLKPNPLRFDGSVYLLVNLQTYSSAADFAQCFKHYKRGTIIGEETGGLIKSYGDIVPARLPHTQLDMTISSALYYDIGAGESDWRGVVPDKTVPAEMALKEAMKLIRHREKH